MTGRRVNITTAKGLTVNFEEAKILVAQIATERVKMFDANDGSYMSQRSADLFKEYTRLRKKFSDNGELSKIYHNLWETL